MNERRRKRMNTAWRHERAKKSMNNSSTTKAYVWDCVSGSLLRIFAASAYEWISL